MRKPLGYAAWSAAVAAVMFLAVSAPVSSSPIQLLARGGTAFLSPTRIGLQGGPSMPSLTGGTNEWSRGYSSRVAPYFGLFADYRLGRDVSIRLEVNYASQGGKRGGRQPFADDGLAAMLQLPPGTTFYADYENETILDYVEIPVMAKMTWGRRSHFFVDLGPYVGFLLRAKTLTDGWSAVYDGSGVPLPLPGPVPFGDPAGGEKETDSKKDINSTNWGIAGGAGLETPLGPGNVVVNAHFSFGLSNIQRNKMFGENNTGALVMTVGYVFMLGGRG
jgi:hypothetical protein